MVVSRNGGNDTEGVYVAHLVEVDGTVDAAARLIVGCHDVGYLQAGNVERLAGRHARHGPARNLSAQGGKGRIGMARHDKLAMYLVSHHRHAVTQADVAHALQLLARPHAAGGVVRIAEQHERHARVGSPAFQVVEVHAIGAAVPQERALLGHAAVVAYGGEEAVVHGRLHQHLVARHGEGPDDGRQGRHHADGVDDVAAVNRPSVAAREPSRNGIVISIRHTGIAENAVLHAARQCLGDGGRRAKIHVGHPQRQHVRVGSAVPLHGVRAPAGNKFVEIECFSHCNYVFKIEYALIVVR